MTLSRRRTASNGPSDRSKPDMREIRGDAVNDVDEHLMTVFTAALDCGTAEERTACLERACAGKPGLRERVEALLRAHYRGGNFLGEAPPDQTATFVSAPGPGVRSSSRAYGEEIRRL